MTTPATPDGVLPEYAFSITKELKLGKFSKLLPGDYYTADQMRDALEQQAAALQAQSAELARLRDIEQRAKEAMGVGDDDNYNSAFWAARTMKRLRVAESQLAAARGLLEKALPSVRDSATDARMASHPARAASLDQLADRIAALSGDTPNG